MVIISSYATAVILCVITMLCWGSWANTLKLASREWAFPLYYWDYSIGIILLSLIIGLTIGSTGDSGRGFINDLSQASGTSVSFALMGGVIFNLANLLIVAAISIAGMAVAFPIAIGLALIIGVFINYVAEPKGNPVLLFIGVGLVIIAILLNAVAYRTLPSSGKSTTTKGILISILSGIIMGVFYLVVKESLSMNFTDPDPGKMTPYSAVFVFSIGIFLSNFIWNTWFMYKPIYGEAVSYADYFKKGNLKLHMVGILGGIIWCLGMSFSLIASEQAGPAISYGLGQGATLIAAIWGVFIWKEFREASRSAIRLLFLMFAFFITGLLLIIFARI
jgi:glucose uptake protein